MEKYHNVNEVSDCRQLNPIWRSMFLNYLVDQLTFHLVPTRIPSVLINSLNNLLVDYSLLKILGNSHTTRFSISLTNNSSSNRKFRYPLICCFDERAVRNDKGFHFRFIIRIRFIVSGDRERTKFNFVSIRKIFLTMIARQRVFHGE